MKRAQSTLIVVAKPTLDTRDSLESSLTAEGENRTEGEIASRLLRPGHAKPFNLVSNVFQQFLLDVT